MLTVADMGEGEGGSKITEKVLMYFMDGPLVFVEIMVE